MSQWHGQLLFSCSGGLAHQSSQPRHNTRLTLPCTAVPFHHLFTTALGASWPELTEVRTYFHSPASKEAVVSTLCLLPASGAPSTAVVTNDTLLHTPYSTHLGRPWPHDFPQAHCFNPGDFQNGKLLTEHVQRALGATGRETWVWHEKPGPTHTTCFPSIPSLVKPRCYTGWMLRPSPSSGLYYLYYVIITHLHWTISDEKCMKMPNPSIKHLNLFQQIIQHSYIFQSYF